MISAVVPTVKAIMYVSNIPVSKIESIILQNK
jgi:hypothetical protein